MSPAARSNCSEPPPRPTRGLRCCYYGGADLQSGKIVFDYSGDPSSSPASAIKDFLTYSYNTATGSTHWARGQFQSSTATANKGLGWKDDAANNEVIVMYTYYGDANLDGTVNNSDLGLLLSNLGSTTAVWAQGDFNYDGTVNNSDLGLLLSNLGSTIAGTSITVPETLDSAALAMLASAGVSVTTTPEPSTLALLAAVLAGLLAYAWRKRK